VDPSVNKWDQPFVLGVVDPHDSLSHPAGVSDVQAESVTCLDPDLTFWYVSYILCPEILQVATIKNILCSVKFLNFL
jgi:TBCC domain-containing protein 1